MSSKERGKEKQPDYIGRDAYGRAVVITRRGLRVEKWRGDYERVEKPITIKGRRV